MHYNHKNMSGDDSENISQNDCLNENYENSHKIKEICKIPNDELAPKRLEELSYHINALLELIGEDVKRDGLMKTPIRSAKSWIELTSGYNQDLDTIINDATFTNKDQELVIVKNISFFSLCEHHLLPFHGKCHIGYRPNNKILGLSKFARIVDMFSKRLQVQEQLGNQIGKAIYNSLQCHGVIVVIEANHCCMMMRGVCKTESSTVTISRHGCMNHPEERNSFFELLRGCPT